MQLDVWELAFVRAWPTHSDEIDNLEKLVYQTYKGTILAGKILSPPTGRTVLPKPELVRILNADEVERRKDPRLRFPRQLRHLEQLLDIILNRKDSPDQRRSLEAHMRRLQRRYQEFIGAAPPEEDEASADEE
jgi:hypothetical protein